VLLSSIFFMADSVVSGNFTTANSSSFWAEGALQTQSTRSVRLAPGTETQSRLGLGRKHICSAAFHRLHRSAFHRLHRIATHLMRGYFGVRAFFSVFGLWKTTEYRGLCCFLNTPFLTALAAFAALALLLSAHRYTREREKLPTGTTVRRASHWAPVEDRTKEEGGGAGETARVAESRTDITRPATCLLAPLKGGRKICRRLEPPVDNRRY